MRKRNAVSQRDSVSSGIRALYDEFKTLILTCAPNFPKAAIGGLEFLADVIDLQAVINSYQMQLLVRLFRSANPAVIDHSSILSRASDFDGLWEKRQELSKKVISSEKKMDIAIRRRVRSLLEQMYLLGEDELRALTRDEDIPGMLYYSSMVHGGLCWYAGRYLARMTGELAKIGHY